MRTSQEPPARVWPCFLPLLAGLAATALTVHWILHEPHWQAHPWPLWIAGTLLSVATATVASVFVTALGVVVAFERETARRRRAAGEFTRPSSQCRAAVPSGA